MPGRTNEELQQADSAGTPTPIHIEAEAFFNNSGGPTTETCTDTGGGQDLTNLSNTTWSQYVVTVPTAGTYLVNFRVAGTAAGHFQFKDSSLNILATVNVPSTGGNQTWTTITATVVLPAGTQKLHFYVTQSGWNMNWFELVLRGVNGANNKSGVGGYRYGFNGKENDDDVKGEGNQQDYGMRIYDPRLGRFLSIDPLTSTYPELTPYQFSSNRPIDGIDLDGLEYKSAANWAQKNISNYTIPFNKEYDIPPSFKNLRQPNWKDVVGNTLGCSTSTALAYAQGDKKVAETLQGGKFETPRFHQMEYFKKGNKYASFVKPEDYKKGERGDILFLQNPDNNKPGSGHAAILATNTRDKGQGKFTVNAYSTNAGNSNDPNHQNTFGEVIYLFDKNEDGKTQLIAKWWFDSDNKVFKYEDMKKENLFLQGFGRVDEDKIKSDATKKPKNDNNKKPKKP